MIPKNQTYEEAVIKMNAAIDNGSIEITDEWDNVNQYQRKEVRFMTLDALNHAHEVFSEYHLSNGWFYSVDVPRMTGTPLIVKPWG